MVYDCGISVSAPVPALTVLTVKQNNTAEFIAANKSLQLTDTTELQSAVVPFTCILAPLVLPGVGKSGVG